MKKQDKKIMIKSSNNKRLDNNIKDIEITRNPTPVLNVGSKRYDDDDDYGIDEESISYYDDDEMLSKNEYKSRIGFYDEVSKPILAIFFTFFNILNHKRRYENIHTYKGVTFKGILNSESSFTSLSEYPPTTFTTTILLIIDDNLMAFSMGSYLESGKIRNFIKISSLDETLIKSEVIYNKLYTLAVEASNLKGSYMTVSDEYLEWRVSDLKDLSFNDVFLPNDLMVDLEMFVKLHETKQLLPRYLFCGAPGTGKTESTRAISKILNSDGVTIIKTNICKIIKEKFELAKILAPSVIILDDLDLYLGDRNSGVYSPLLGVFLDILDGLEKLPDNVGLIASTNAPHLIDLAAQRPGRFDKVLFFDELTLTNIKSIIIKSLNKMDKKFKNVSNEDIEILTDERLIQFFKDKGLTGAFIHEVVQSIKNKSEIMGLPMDVDEIINSISKSNHTLEQKLKSITIDNSLKITPKQIGY